MGARKYEQDLAQINGVNIVHWAKPLELVSESNRVKAVAFERTALDDSGKLSGTGESFTLDADVVFKAIGQTFLSTVFPNSQAPEIVYGRISVDADRLTTLPGVWAGGDCIDGGDDLTVAAVEDGKVAAMSIDQFLKSGEV